MLDIFKKYTPPQFISKALAARIPVTVKPVLSGHSKKTKKNGFQDRLLLNSGQKYCRIFNTSYHLPLSPLFCLFLSGRLRQVLLFWHVFKNKVENCVGLDQASSLPNIKLTLRPK